MLNGALHRLLVVGVAMSPEYVFAISGRELVADDRRFAVLWMHREAVAPLYRMEGAFNDVALALEAGASGAAVLDAVDRVLAPYGGVHAVPRARQISNYVLSGELDNLRNLALMIPAVFLAVAAFLVNVVIARLVFLERTQIGHRGRLDVEVTGGLSEGDVVVLYPDDRIDEGTRIKQR